MRRLVAAVLVLALGGCAAPALHSYLLATTPTLTAAAAVEALPTQVIELRPVLLPDHLDTNEILRRVGPSELVGSRNGRWGDRLSVAIRLALAADLQAALPRMAVVIYPPPGMDVQVVDLTVTAFDLDASGTLVLEADWSIKQVRQSVLPVRRRIRLAETGVSTGDEAQVAAMSRSLRQLATAMAKDF